MENNVNMRNIYTENTNGYLMHLYALLAKAGEGMAQWAYEAASQEYPLIHTIATSESGTSPGSRPIYLSMGVSITAYFPHRSFPI